MNKNWSKQKPNKKNQNGIECVKKQNKKEIKSLWKEYNTKFVNGFLIKFFLFSNHINAGYLQFKIIQIQL